MKACTLGDRVRRHFEGSISPDAEHAMRRHLPDCDSCRRLYRRHLLLSRLDPEALPSEERLARGLGFRPRRLHVRRAVGLGAAAVAAAALALLVLRKDAPTDAFSPRGPAGPRPPSTSRVLVYAVPEDGVPVPAAGSVRSGGELAFAYENGSAKRRLAIFGVDEHGHVYWFHPAWTDTTEDPVAIPVAGDGERHELPEAIRQRFDGRHLEIRSLFVDDSISVREIEGRLRQTPSGPLPIPGAVESSLSLEVVP